LKWFVEVNLFFCFQVVQIGVNMMLQLGEKALETTLSAFGKGANLNCLPE
jgi:hypothetical protein